MKKQIIWIYEYKDDDTPLGTTLIRCSIEDIDEEIKLPHLHPDWHWRIDTLWEDIEE